VPRTRARAHTHTHTHIHTHNSTNARAHTHTHTHIHTYTHNSTNSQAVGSKLRLELSPPPPLVPLTSPFRTISFNASMRSRTPVKTFVTVGDSWELRETCTACGVCCWYRMCSLTTECVLLLQNVCSFTTECGLLLQNVFPHRPAQRATPLVAPLLSYYRMCSLTTECVLLQQNVASYYRMCSPPDPHSVRRFLLPPCPPPPLDSPCR